MKLVDSDQRIRATDPTQSFIVQAPAGSGKTEILTQRYLRLLGTVTAPEQIIALTFTRKAASEMRERIILALQQAANNHQANSPHQQMTLDFAHSALLCDQQHQWNLLQQTNRLKIITIDSLCQSINQAIPLMEQQIAYSQVTEKAERYYLKASRHCIRFALNSTEYQQAIKTLLLHVDNRQDHLLELFTSLLAQRDQWLAPLFQAKIQKKEHFEQALKLIEAHELNRFRQNMPLHLAEELVQCTRELACIENNPESPRYPLKDWYHFDQINADIARALAKLLLTGDAQFRKSFDHHVGLLSTSCSAQEYKRLKNASKELLMELNEYPDFLETLLQVSNLPRPEYPPEQWDVLQALFLLLPLLVSHLHVLFAEHNEVDFTTVSQQALTALGEAESPTDLALYLDNAIHHLLVDEFQDTSINQFTLLTKLVHGWEPGDGKTLFLVGDPMQSIYRFRQAEVGLFFRAKESGIGSVQLTSLQLSCNFRSTQTIIAWINQHFAHIFPRQIDIESGAVSFHASVNALVDETPSVILARQFKSREQEAQYLIEAIQNELHHNPEHNIAILVRSRTQLSEIIRLLRQHQIPYQGTDITLLTRVSHLRDVWVLTQALLSPANRLYWLALLRSPYCGIALTDVHSVANFNKKKSIYAALLQLDKIEGLSSEGLIRLRFFLGIMHQALAQRYEHPLSVWVRNTLKKLHADHILHASQHEDLEQLWTLIDSYEQEGRLPDQHEFLAELKKLYSQQTTPSRLQIMTIHKSKGLEFDTVFLPGLGTPTNRGDNPLLRWLNLPTRQGNLLLMSPIQAAHHERCALYDYLNQLDTIKNNYETQRLLYVAVTRAKSRLYLTDYSDKSPKNSFRSLLSNQEFSEKELQTAPDESSPPLPELKRLPLTYYQNTDPLVQEHPSNLASSLSSSIPRLIGIISHQLLQWICNQHPQTPEEIPWNLALYEFKKAGFDAVMQQTALNTLKERITRLFHDPIGSWIIAPQAQEKNEYELLVKHAHDRPATRVIDRLFEHQQKLWIVDFKTGKEEEQTLLKYRAQLNEYGRHLQEQSILPIHCGIYYLATNRWIHWRYEPYLSGNVAGT